MLLGAGFEGAVLAVLGLVILTIGVTAYHALPASLRTRSLKGSYRRDGTFSRRRSQIERRFRWKFATDAMAGTALLSLPIILLGFLFHQYVIPSDIAVESLEKFHPDGEVWRERLEDPQAGGLRERHERWVDSSDTTRRLQAFLWNAWPAVLMGFLVLFLVTASLIGRYLRRLARQFARKLNRRCFEYDLADLQPATDVPVDASHGDATQGDVSQESE